MHEYDYYRQMCFEFLKTVLRRGGAYVVLFVINLICAPTIKRHVFIRVLHIGGSVYEYDTT